MISLSKLSVALNTIVNEAAFGLAEKGFALSDGIPAEINEAVEHNIPTRRDCKTQQLALVDKLATADSRKFVAHYGTSSTW